MTVPGTQGYEKYSERFIEISQALDFHLVCNDFLGFLPSEHSRVLDLGAGGGQNAAALSALGFSVTAVEPMQAFLEAAQLAYKDVPVKWLNDSLPYLSYLRGEYFSFILIDGVWHHLNQTERAQSVSTISAMTQKQGRCALSLRNGPAGMGTRVYPINTEGTIELFKKVGFKCVFRIDNQASILPNKGDVIWSRIVMEKC